MGIAAVCDENRRDFGMIGVHGKKAAMLAVRDCDLLILIGARVGDRAVRSPVFLQENTTIIHIDIDPAEIGKNIKTNISIVADSKQVLQELLKTQISKKFTPWVKELKDIKEKHSPKLTYSKNSKTISPPFLLSCLSDLANENAIITTEVGQNQIWAANYYKTQNPMTFISSGGMGTMGYGLPAAIGAKMGRPDLPVIALSGDGSLQMSIQELGTAKQQGLELKIILLNNSRLGMVREMQKDKFSGRYSYVYMEHNPDFQQLAAAYGFLSEKIYSNSEVADALQRMLTSDSPYLLECIIDPDEPTLC